jgi:ATP-dependent DNA helicase PIF1
VARKPRIKITAEYKQVKKLLRDGAPVVFVTGKAGTGKSTLIHHLRDTVKGNVVVLAPTGVAAMNIQGATIHSFFRLPPRLVLDDDVKSVEFTRPYDSLDLLIIDEVSMVRADVMDAIDRFLRMNGPDKSLPFGGVQLLLVGDLHQLPPVVKGAEEQHYFETNYDSPFFFDSHALKAVDMAAVELTEIFRQKDDAFITLLNDVRLGRPGAATLEALNARITPRADADRETVLSTTNLIADRINKRHMAALPSDAEVFVGAMEGDFNIRNDRLPAPMELLLKPEARVMFTKNDPEGRWVNGSLGHVSELTKKSITVTLDESSEEVEVGPALWETYRYQFDEDEGRNVALAVGSYLQMPLTPAWAITIHKAQGKTLSAARIDLGHRAFAAGQVYVALSRCRRLEDLTLSRAITTQDVFCDTRVVSFYGKVSRAARVAAD